MPHVLGRPASASAEARRHASAAIGACALVAACTAQASLPGTALGTYNVTGTLGTNTCGSSLGPSNPWTFSVSLSKDGTTLYWENTSGSGQLSGALNASGMATLTTTITANVDASEAGAGACYLQDTQTIALALASGSTPSGFTGTFTYAFAVATTIATSVNCGDQLASAGGPYATLPCTVAYSLKATRR
ncbi:MAG: hypothetical protein M3O36_19910 [Myxococcota bacterium]|nr:hypothetical protein [Myxococcota bacterium]